MKSLEDLLTFVLTNNVIPVSWINCMNFEFTTVPGLTSVILENETFPRALLYWTRAASQGVPQSLVINQYE